MNLRDNQQDVTSARDNVDLVSKGLIDIKSIQSEADLYLKELSEEWKASIPFTCYIINENNQPCSYPIGVVGCLDMYRTKVLLYHTMVLLARPTKVRR